MTTKIDEVIEFIYNNFRFESSVKIDVLMNLFDRFQLNLQEKDALFYEVEMLNISLEFSESPYIDKLIKQYFSYLNGKSSTDDLFAEWILLNKITKVVSNYLHQLFGDDTQVVDLSFDEDTLLDYLDGLDFDAESLDEVVLSEKFEVGYENPIDMSFNSEYLKEYQSSDSDEGKRLESLEKLLQANTRLVKKVVSNYGRRSTASFDYDDMYQEGIIGMIKAADRFDISLDNQFSTYAMWWLRQSITRALDDYSTTIRIPVHTNDKVRKLVRIENDLFSELGRMFTDNELIDKIEVETGNRMTQNDLNSLRIYRDMSSITGLETPVGSGKTTMLGDFIEDNNIIRPDEFAFEEERYILIQDVMKHCLKQREIDVLTLRFGLKTGNQMTLEEVGKVFGVTRERIRQIEAKALRKLKSYSKKVGLEDYL